MSENHITPEQRAAWQRLSNAPGAIHKPGVTVKDDAALIAALLPSDLTDPQPVLPTEPGLYIGGQGITGPVWRIPEGGTGSLIRDGHFATVADGPFRRLVPKREPITRGQVELLVKAHRSLVLTDAELVNELVTLVNGADR